MKRILLRIFFPGMPAILFFAVTATFFHILSFLEAERSNLFSFIAYTFTVYVFLTVAAEIPRSLIRLKRTVWGNGKSTCIIFSKEFRTRLALCFGWLLNLIYAAFKLLVCVFYNSFWFATEAIYFLMLSIIRFTLVKYERDDSNNLLGEWKAYRLCGFLMLILNVLITIIIVISARNNKIFEYPHIILYVSGGYTLYRLVSSLVQMTRFRKGGRPVLSAAKAINISASALSLFTFASTLITYAEKPQKIGKIIAGVGWTVCAVIIGVSLFMVIRSSIIIKKQSKK